MPTVIKRPNLSVAFARGFEAVVRFPLPAACSVGFAVLYLGDQHDVSNIDTERPLSALALGFFAALAGGLFAEQRNWPRAMGLLCSALLLGAVAAIIFASPGQYDDVWLVHFLFLLPGLVLLVMVAPFLARSGANDAFWCFNRGAWFGAALGFASALLVATAAMALFAAFDTLFGIDVDSDLYSNTWVVCLAVIWPWIALSAMPRDFTDPPAEYAPIWVRFVAGTLLVPIASIYLIVLYVYAIYILFSWDLPRGNVADVACGFAAVGVITHLIVHPWRETGGRLQRAYHRYFYVLLFVPIALLAVAVGKRVADYGVTEERYFLMLAAVWLASTAVYFALRGRRLVLVPASLSVLAIAASFGTWGAAATSERSQVEILRTLLTDAGLLRDGAVVKSEAPLEFELRKRISSVVGYLSHSGKHPAIAPWFDDTDVDFAEDGRTVGGNIVAALGFTFVGEWQSTQSFSFTGPDRSLIDVAAFDLLAERSLHGYQVPDITHGSEDDFLALRFDKEPGVLSMTATDGSSVSFALGDLASELIGTGYSRAGGGETEQVRQAMTLDAADGSLRVRLLVTSLWGEVDADVAKNISAEVILLIGERPGGD